MLTELTGIEVARSRAVPKQAMDSKRYPQRSTALQVCDLVFHVQLRCMYRSTQIRARLDQLTWPPVAPDKSGAMTIYLYTRNCKGCLIDGQAQVMYDKWIVCAPMRW